MGSTLLEDDVAVGHLLRRAGFGLSAADADTYRKLGYRGAVRRLLDELDAPPPADPPHFDAYEPGAIQQVWLDRMVNGLAPLAEKLALFWHGHFATSDTKIREPLLMWRQYQLFRAHGAGRFRPLVEKVSRDVAMIRWLDGNANRKGTANENYARELQELFTLGIGNYTEQDIREIARAFTGWGSRHHTFVYADAFHDHGVKTVHGHQGDLDGDDVVRILTDLPACKRFIAGKLLRFFSHPSPTPAEVQTVAEVLEKTGGDIRSALFVMFQSPSFRAAERHRALVKSPVEFLVGALRAVGIPTTPLWVHGGLERMGQILFRPPSVKGWPSGTAWLTSAAVVERVKAARRLADAHPGAAAGIVDLAFDREVPGTLAARLTAAKGKEKVALALACPEYQLA
ncbi:MAG: DUF1800 domain-containing protein [Planctomycetota bacterium]|jgi:uncharacterized protein (DUF1800 family)